MPMNSALRAGRRWGGPTAEPGPLGGPEHDAVLAVQLPSLASQIAGLPGMRASL